jgi:hypothetical protein
LALRVKHEVVEVRKVGIYQRCKVKEFRLMIEFLPDRALYQRQLSPMGIDSLNASSGHASK